MARDPKTGQESDQRADRFYKSEKKAVKNKTGKEDDKENVNE